jgi:RNA polymerase sigma factor for flagellar operon FliA
MHPEELLRQNLPLVERIVERVCRRANVVGADVEDFASIAKIALIENDYAILRGYEGRAPLAAFLAVIIQRLLADEWIRTLGRWRPSAQARRLGDAGVMIEKLVRREQRPVEAVLPIVQAVDPSMTRARIEEIAAQLPEQVRRPRAVELDDAVAEVAVAHDTADAGVLEGEARRVAARAATVVRSTMQSLDAEDRLILRFRFVDDLGIADIARMLQLPQRPLYRRIEALLTRLRGALTDAAIQGEDLPELLRGADLLDEDFGLRNGKTGTASQTSVEGVG